MPEDAVKKFIRAATSRLNLGVVGAAATAAAALQSWPVVALGGAAYTAVVAWDFVSGKKDKAETIPGAATLHDASMQRFANAIGSANVERETVLRDTSDEVKANLALTLASAAELEARAGKLVRRGDELARYLATVNPHAVAKSVADLTQRVSQTPDAEARAHYESARIARVQHYEAIQELALAKERIEATLLSIAATLDGLAPKVVRMRTLDAAAMDALSGNLKSELDTMNVEIESFEEALASLTRPPSKV